MAWGPQLSASVKEEDNEDGGHVQEGSEHRPSTEAPASRDNRGDNSIIESGKGLDKASIARALGLGALFVAIRVGLAIALVALRGLVTAPLLVFVTPVVVVASDGKRFSSVIQAWA